MAEKLDRTSLSWLHISDLHFGQVRDQAIGRFDQELVTRGILEDAVEISETLGQPDFVLLTGDVAFAGKPLQYAQARSWLEELCSGLKIDLNRVLVVPGNHDVDRATAASSLISRTTHQALRASPAELSELLQEERAPQLAASLWPKLEAFAEFVGELGGPLLGPSSPFWTRSVESELGSIYFIGLNTCLLSLDDTDDASTLALGLGQLVRAFRQVPKDAMVMVLMHHPPEWLADGAPRPPGQEAPSVRIDHLLTTFLHRYPHLLFCGHVHVQGGGVTTPLHSGGEVRFVAGAGHQAAREAGTHAFAWGRLHRAGLDFVPRYWDSSRQDFRAERNRFDLDEQGRMRIDVRSLPELHKKWLMATKPLVDDRSPASLIRPNDRVLIVNYQGIMTYPDGISQWGLDRADHVFEVPSEVDMDLVGRLRSPTLDKEAWAVALEQIDSGAAAACEGLGGELHVFCAGPHGLGLYLGRRLDDLARHTRISVYQYDVRAKEWLLFQAPFMVVYDGDFFSEPEPTTSAGGRGVLVSLEVIQSATQRQLEEVRDSIGLTAIHRLVPRDMGVRYLDQLPQIAHALIEAEKALERIRDQWPDAPIHLVTSAPLAFLISLGRRLRPTVFGEVVVHHFDAERQRYYPVLEVTRGKLWEPRQLSYLASIALTNFKRFKAENVALPGRPGWVVLAGRNGAGKSALLQAIALALLGPDSVKQDSLSRVFLLEDCSRVDGPNGSISVTLVPVEAAPDPQQHTLRLNWNARDGEIEGKGHDTRAVALDHFFYAGYGPFRRLGRQDSGALDPTKGPHALTRVRTLFREDGSLSEGLTWLGGLDHVRRSAKGSERGERAQKLLDVALALLSDGLLPDETMQAADVDDRGLWLDQHGERLLLTQLSDGYRCAVSLVLDILRLLDAHQRLELCWEEGHPLIPVPGIVLIDEIDAHLHVSWQQRIGKWLASHFVGVQFIVTTHSPYICQAANEGGLIRLPSPDEPKGKIEAIPDDEFFTIKNGAADEATLSSLFGLERTWSREAEELRREVAQLEAGLVRGRGGPEERKKLEALSRQMPRTMRSAVRRVLDRLRELS